MKLLIAGSSDINERTREFFENRRAFAAVAPDVSAVTNFEGEVGDFTATLEGRAISPDFVVITERTACRPDPVLGEGMRGLFDDTADVMAARPRKKPDVFLLDFFRESPAYATARALAASAELAAKKRMAYCLARFTRTADYESESLYGAARRAGVIFVKYDGIEIERENGIFRITANDGAITHGIEAENVYADGTRDVGEPFRLISKIFGLRADAGGYLSEDRYFLSPIRTSRRGVYHIGRESEANLDETLARILACAKADMDGIDVEKARHATVDAGKCVLCLTCRRACPHAAMRPDKDMRAMKNLRKACEGCGICAALCPCGAISLAGNETRSTGTREKTLILCCENSALPAMEESMPMLGKLASGIDLRGMPCGGSVVSDELGDALASYGGVIAAVCVEGACRHFEGNRRACLQAGRIASMLKLAGLGANIAVINASHARPRELADSVADFVNGFSRAEPGAASP